MEPLEWSESRTDQLSGTLILGAPLPVTRPRQCETREMLKRSRRITDVANSMLGLRRCIGGQDTRAAGSAARAARARAPSTPPSDDPLPVRTMHVRMPIEAAGARSDSGSS